MIDTSLPEPFTLAEVAGQQSIIYLTTLRSWRPDSGHPEEHFARLSQATDWEAPPASFSSVAMFLVNLP